MLKIGEVYPFLLFGKNVCSAFVCFAVFGRKFTNSICVVAMGAIRFSVCVASVAHTFCLWEGYRYEKIIFKFFDSSTHRSGNHRYVKC